MGNLKGIENLVFDKKFFYGGKRKYFYNEDNILFSFNY